MSNTVPEQPQPQISQVDAQQAAQAQAQAQAQNPAQPDPGQAPAAEPQDVASLPKWAQDQITSTRTEAANYRTQLRAAQEQLGKAKTPEEFQAAVTDLNDRALVLERENVALTVGLPPALAARLQGTTRDELIADAQAVLSLLSPQPAPAPVPAPAAPQSGTVPTGGLNPSSDPMTESPLALANRVRNRMSPLVRSV